MSDHTDDVVFRRATSKDLERLDALESYGRGSSQRRLVTERNDLLFVACHGDRIVATRRFTAELHDPLAARVITLQKGQIWVADLFCIPEYRRTGVTTELVRFVDHALAAHGYREIIGTVDAGNVASLRLSAREGFRFVAYVSYARVLSFERLRIAEQLPVALQAIVRSQER